MSRCLVCQAPTQRLVRVRLDTAIVIYMCQTDKDRWASFGLEVEWVTAAPGEVGSVPGPALPEVAVGSGTDRQPAA